jgi:hypothetical protein
MVTTVCVFAAGEQGEERSVEWALRLERMESTEGRRKDVRRYMVSCWFTPMN